MNKKQFDEKVINYFYDLAISSEEADEIMKSLSLLKGTWIGDIENIVSFQNVTGIIRKLKNENSFVIAIDAALSCNSNRIGKIIVNQIGYENNRRIRH